MRRALLMFTTMILLLPACRCGEEKKKPDRGLTRADAGAARAIKKATKPGAGLAFRLEEGEVSGRAERGAFTRGKVMPDVEARRLLARLKAPAVKKDDVKAFALRGRGKPAPRRGATVKTVFPPPEKAPPPVTKEPGKLQVLRSSPEGKVALAPNLSVTFSQPMVAVTSHADSIAKGVPVKLSPRVQGTWRWVGTRTLLLQPKIRFAMATTYRATVPAGTTSARGGKLAKERTWTFTTPAPRLQQYTPSSGPQRRDVLLFCAFDQKIDAAAVLKTITLEGDGDRIALRLAGPAEVEQDKVVARLAKAATAGRWLAFRAQKRLPAATRFTVTVGPGTPSAEGPLKTTVKQTFSFRTYGPLKVVKHGCGWRKECPPLRPFRVRFNNRLDGDAFTPKRLSIEPKLPDHTVRVTGNMLYIHGKTRGRTTYTVVIPKEMTDVYGQQLGSPRILTFRTTKAQPRLFSPGRPLMALDPDGKKSLRVYSVNHDRLKLRVYAVKPEQYPKFREFLRDGMRQDTPRTPPGTLRVHRTLRPKGEADSVVETRVDLRPYLTGGHGNLVVLVTQDPLPAKPYRRQYVARWIMSTELGLDAFVDHGRMLAWVTRLRDGAAVAGARVALTPGGPAVTTGKDGLASIPLPAGPSSGSRVLWAKAGGDLVFLPDSTSYWHRGGSQWTRRAPPGERLRWYVFDDRKLYRPGETVNIKGWARFVNMGSRGGLRLPKRGKLRYRAMGSRGNKIAAGQVDLGRLGGFHIKVKLPKNANLGQARVELTAGEAATYAGRTHWHRFRIQEFRRPEFEVTARASDGPHLLGGQAQLSATARYFAGGGLPDAKVSWYVSATPGSFVPPKQSGYTFVGWSPGWYRYIPRPRTAHQSFTGRTDARGTHRLRVHLDGVDPPRPMSLMAQANVQDVNRQSFSTSASFLVHPANHYVGLKTKRYFVRKGKPLEVDAVVADLDGERVAGSAITMTAARLVDRWEKGKYLREEKDVQTCAVTSALKEDARCTFKTPRGGTYLIRAVIKDPRGRANRTEMTRWVSGGTERPRQRNVAVESLRLVADKDRYQPGDTAELLVLPPFTPAQGLMTVRRAGILHKERFSIAKAGGSVVLRVPIKETHLPGLTVQVDLVGSAPRLDEQGKPLPKLPRRPALARGSVSLSVPPLQRKLSVEVKPGKAKLEPGGKTNITVTLRDARQRPVADGEVAIVVVDEAVLALTGYKLWDPITTFYPFRGAGVRDHHMRPLVTLADVKALIKTTTEQSIIKQGEVGGMGLGNRPLGRGDDRSAMDEESPASRHAGRSGVLGALPPPSPAKRRSRAKGKKGGGGRAAPIALRKDFSALALFAPAVRTDAAGQAVVEFKVPDNLTRYRVWVVAVATEKYYGKGEATVTTRKPLMVRPSAPRFLNFGDRFELPVVVQNQTDQPLAVQVAVRATNARMVQGLGRTLTVPANDRLEVRFPAAAVRPGTARFQMVAASGTFADAAEVSLPVWTPATTEAFATYGTVDRGSMVQPVKMPPGVVPTFGGLDITTSSTQLQALTDAVLYLVSYRFECSEQLSSRLLAVAALKDVLAAFSAPGLPPPQRILAAVKRDLTRLQRMQNSDGGFGFWRRGQRSWPYLSAHVTHALARAKAKGFAVPPRTLQRAIYHLRNIERHIPHWYSAAARRAVIAYSLYVLNVAGHRDVAKAKRIFARLKKGKQKLPLEAVAWLYPVLSGQAGAAAEVGFIRKLLRNRVSETAATAQFASSYGDSGYLVMHSSRRVDALLLEGLIVDQPRSDLIVKLVRGLLGHRKRGRWGNTQENAWVLLALDRYFRAYEKVTPNFVARAWLGDRFAGQHAFRGRSTERKLITVPMQQLAALKAADLVLAKKGAGRLYYRVGLRYAPADLKPPAASHGFTVRRRYEAVDKATDVRRDTDGTWRIKAGARVRVSLTMVAPARRYHVALVDPLPAGLEAINAGLRGAETTPGAAASRRARPKSGGRGRGWHYWRWMWRGHWYEHTNMRDERVEAFTSLLWPGVHTHSYTARATTPGTFVVPPPKAEEMYHPETFGRGAGDKVVVE